MKKTWWIALAAVVVLSLTSCTADAEQSSSEPASSSATPETDTPKTYSTIDELVDDGIGAGMTCEKIRTPRRERLAADSRYCNDSETAFSIYATDTDLEKARKEAIQFAKIWAEYGEPVASLLIGPNWLVEGSLDEVKVASESMGGVVQNLENVPTG